MTACGPLFLRAAALFGMALFASHSWADDLSDAKAAYAQHQFVQAAKLFRDAAAKGNPDAMSFLGVMYHDGEGVPKDAVRSCMWFYVALTIYEPLSDDFRQTSEFLDALRKELGESGTANAHRMAENCIARHYESCD
jgi:hypothetical protein